MKTFLKLINVCSSREVRLSRSSMAWGEALVRAYECESNRAVYPRIIIDKKLRIPENDEPVKISDFIFLVLPGEDGLFRH